MAIGGNASAVALGVLGVAVLHCGFKIPLKAAMLPVVVLLAIEVALYFAMYWIRTRFQQTRDLRPAVMAFGAFTLVVLLMGMRYAEQLGISSPGTFSANYV